MAHIDKADVYNFTGPGWRPLLAWLTDRLSPEAEILQVKEKFGGLRFYITGGEHKDHDLVRFAEKASYLICEGCGTTMNVSTGRSEGSYWIKTFCSDCREQWELERNNK